MSSLDILNLGTYSERYKLPGKITTIRRIIPPPIDLGRGGLILHGSEADPYLILKYGLVPQQTDKNKIESEWQVCLGLNSNSGSLTIRKDLARKNSAIKYSGQFSLRGIVYIIADEVKRLPGYKEFWDEGVEGRGYAWVTQPILPKLITGLITENLPLAAAALLACQENKPVYRPDGSCYKVEPV